MKLQDLTVNYKDIPKGVHFVNLDGKKQFMTSNEYKKILKNNNIEVQSMTNNSKKEELKTNYIESQEPLLPPGVQPMEETVVSNATAEQQVEEFESKNDILLSPEDRRTMTENIKQKQQARQVGSGKTKEPQESPLLPIGVKPVT